MQSRAAAEDSAAATIDATILEEWALSYLGRYSSTAANLREVLRRRVRRRLRDNDSGRSAADGLIDELVARYRDTRLLDDAAYAASRARRGLTQGQSLRRIAAGLAAKGVAAPDAAAAIASLRDDASDPELAAACAFARRRKLGPFRTGPSGRSRELGAFARAGFGRHVAETIMACADEADVAALLARSSG